MTLQFKAIRSCCDNPRAVQGKWRGAFTLLELLVVVAVIALLLAILLPSLSRARGLARSAACQMNLKEIARAWHMYLDDSNGEFPSGLNVNVNYGGEQGQGSDFYGKDPNNPIHKRLNRYLGMAAVVRDSGGVFTCPSDQGLAGVRPTAIHYYGTSYYPNDILIGRQLWPVFGVPCADAWKKLVGDSFASPSVPGMLNRVRRSAVDTPVSVVLIGDFSWYDNWDPTVADRFPFWHERKSQHNIAFMDGHADSVHIRKGIYVDKQYTVIPFRQLRGDFRDAQEEILQ